MKKSLFLTLVFLALLFMFPSLSVKGAKEGLLLWFNTIIPTLFPFILITNLLRELDGIKFFQKIFGHFIQKLFKTFPNSSYPVIAGLLCGYPIGAKTIADTYDGGYITLEEANYLLTFCNNPSPMFIINFIILTNLKDTALIVPFFIIIYLSTYLSAKIHYFYYWHKKSSIKVKPQDIIKAAEYSEDKSGFFDRCIIDSFELLCKIGGYLMLFSIFNQYISSIPILNETHKIIISGILEQTTGLAKLGQSTLDITIKIVLSITITCFGGLAITAQTYSVIHNKGLSIKKYLIGKILNAFLAFILSLIYAFMIY